MLVSWLRLWIDSVSWGSMTEEAALVVLHNDPLVSHGHSVHVATTPTHERVNQARHDAL